MEQTPPLADTISTLRREIALLQSDMAALRQQNASLKQQVAELRRQLDKNSSNSSKPPSSDGLKKPPRGCKSLRGRSGKTRGGQPGHRGDTLRQVDKPDRIERHAATSCRHCHACLTAAMATGEERRQVFDLPAPRLEVTEHRAATYCCQHCRGTTTAAFPGTITGHVQYGPRLRAAAVYLNVQQLIPEDRVCEAMADLFAAVRLCPASVVAWTANTSHPLCRPIKDGSTVAGMSLCFARRRRPSRRAIPTPANAGRVGACRGWYKAAAAQAPVVAHIAACIVAARVRHLDETGFRVGGKTR